jgi:hypothetical protein
VTLGVALAATCGASALQGQTATDELQEARTWSLQGLRAAYCTRFLVEPELASKERRDGYVLLSANHDQRLHPALRQIVASQAEFASWVPSNLCFYYMDAVQVGRRRLAERNRAYQMIGVWTLSATEAEGGARRDLVVDMYASRSSLLRAAQNAQVRIHEVHSVVSDKADSTLDIYSVKIGKTQLVWNGRHTGDSTTVEEPLQENWSVSGLRASVRVARLELKPAWSWPLVGSLRVEGKGDLAKALRNSPIRFVGPLYRGGSGRLSFSR